MASNQGDVAAPPTKPNLSDLPIELQLLVLRKCVVTSTALLNFGISRKKKYLRPPPFPDARCELFGQDELNLAILFTCRLYNKEGWRILFSENNFSFDVKLSRWPEMVESDIFEFWVKGSRNITSLNLRVVSSANSSDTIRILMDRVRAVKDFPSLRVFRLDFISILITDLPLIHEDSPQDWQNPRLDEYVRMARELYNMKEILQGGLQRPIPSIFPSARTILLGQAEHTLDKVILTGLLDNDLHLLIIKFMALLLKPSGTMEIAKGVDGKKYRFSPVVRNIMMIGEPERVIVPLEELQAWIQRHRSPPSFERIQPIKWEDFEGDCNDDWTIKYPYHV